MHLLHVAVDVKEGRLTAVLYLEHVGRTIRVHDKHAALTLLENLDERTALRLGRLVNYIETLQELHVLRDDYTGYLSVRIAWMHRVQEASQILPLARIVVVHLERVLRVIYSDQV